uniref:Uncharacterized protein n=1 Tax=Tanacetum cinerariifolium TaxID=118510 RepID=A0A699L0C5_TANCI|nr:hypothetical protein [Tanacetum cinerariifolium]
MRNQISTTGTKGENCGMKVVAFSLPLWKPDKITSSISYSLDGVGVAGPYQRKAIVLLSVLNCIMRPFGHGNLTADTCFLSVSSTVFPFSCSIICLWLLRP